MTMTAAASADAGLAREAAEGAELRRGGFAFRARGAGEHERHD
jgi:hypothetical protein